MLIGATDRHLVVLVGHTVDYHTILLHFIHVECGKNIYVTSIY